MVNIFKQRERVYTFSEFLNNDEEGLKRIDKQNDDKRVLYALLFLNPFLSEDKAFEQFNLINEYIASQGPFGLDWSNPFKPKGDAPKVPDMPDIASIPETIGNSIEGVQDLLYYLTNPVEILKIFATITIDLSFTIAAIACIVSLSMFVFTGCKDKDSLKYCGLSLIMYFVVVVILTQFVYLF